MSFMAVSVETAQPQQPPEAERDVVIEEEDTILRTGKGPGDPQEEAAVYPVQALGQPAVQAGQEAIAHLPRFAEDKGQAEILHRNSLNGTARPAQAAMEGLQHFPVTEAHLRLQAQAGRMGKHARHKGRQPPMPFGNLDTGAVFPAKLHGAERHFFLADPMEERRVIFRFGKQPVSVIDADLRAGIDAVLALPELDQPCLAPVIEVHREGVEHHLEAGGHIVVDPCVPGAFLPGVHGGGKEAAATVVHVAEGFRKLLQQGTFLAFFHVPDFADDLPSPEMAEQHAHKSKKK